MAALDNQISSESRGESVSSDGDFDVDQDDEDDDLDYYHTEESIEDTQTQSEDPEWYSFDCLNYLELWPMLCEQVNSLKSKVSLDFSSSLGLLQSFNWNVEKLIQELEKDREKVLRAARIIPDKSERNAYSNSLVTASCSVCLSALPPEMFKSIKCRHCFCQECWLTFFKLKIEEGKSLGIECMMCEVLVPMETVEEILKPQHKVHARYSYLRITDIVLSHRLLRWCPGTDCNMVFLVEEPHAKRVTCSSCNITICFLCGEDYHCPTECEPFKNWLIKCQDDSETFNYIFANTKDCPNCRTSIEKNGGCNHIKCYVCSHDFCWMCLENWSKHCGEYYECSRYKADPSKYKDKADKERSALQKYLFYYERWKNHHQSILLEEQTRRKIQSHIEDMVTASEGTWIDWQYLLDAASLLKKCRYTLKYTYPRAYWMEGDKKQLFEYQQAQLELEIENLSWKVERASRTDRAELEQQMAVTEIRRTTLLRDFTV